MSRSIRKCALPVAGQREWAEWASGVFAGIPAEWSFIAEGDTTAKALAEGLSAFWRDDRRKAYAFTAVTAVTLADGEECLLMNAFTPSQGHGGFGFGAVVAFIWSGSVLYRLTGAPVSVAVGCGCVRRVRGFVGLQGATTAGMVADAFYRNLTTAEGLTAEGVRRLPVARQQLALSPATLGSVFDYAKDCPEWSHLAGQMAKVAKVWRKMRRKVRR